MKGTMLLGAAFLLIVSVSVAQDTIVFANGDQLIGLFKQMDKGVVTFKTKYSNSDFKIEWKWIQQVSTSTVFLITTSEGHRLIGHIVKGDSTGVTIINEGRERLIIPINDIVYLKSINSGFWNNINAHVDVGFNITKANNLRQFTVNSGIGYMGEFWRWDVRYNSLNATQDSVTPTLRRDGGITINRYLQKDFFLTGSMSFLSNTEQLLGLRINGRVGFGYFFVHTNSWLWNVAAGVAFVDESYSSSEQGKASMEAFVSTEVNLFDFKDFSFMTKVVSYPGLTEQGRFRSDINLDLKYELPLDFYVKVGLTMNYDNRPAEGASELDYVVNTGFGWEW